MVNHPYRIASFSSKINYYKIFSIDRKNGGGKSPKPKFDIHVHFENSSQEYEVFIGDRRECVLIFIPKNNPDKIATLQSFNYHSICSIDKNLKKGSGTKRMMKKTLQFIKKKFNIKKVELRDNSYIYCSILKNINPVERNIEVPILNIYMLYIFTHGNPYYVHNFGFNFTNNKIKKINRMNRKIVKNIKINNKLLKDLKNMFKIYEIKDERKKYFFSKLKKYENIRDFIRNENIKDKCDLFFVLIKRLFSLYGIQDLTGECYYINME